MCSWCSFLEDRSFGVSQGICRVRSEQQAQPAKQKSYGRCGQCENRPCTRSGRAVRSRARAPVEHDGSSSARKEIHRLVPGQRSKWPRPYQPWREAAKAATVEAIAAEYEYETALDVKLVHRIEARLVVPEDMIGRIIGRKGQSIQAMARNSGARLTVLSPANTGHSSHSDGTIVIVGMQSQVDKAKAMVRMALDDPNINGQHLQQHAKIRLPVQPDAVPFIIGNKGHSIKGMQAACGARMCVEEGETCSPVIKIRGTASQVDEAKALLALALHGHYMHLKAWQETKEARLASRPGDKGDRARKIAMDREKKELREQCKASA